jgi:hypothetical protein
MNSLQLFPAFFALSCLAAASPLAKAAASDQQQDLGIHHYHPISVDPDMQNAFLRPRVRVAELEHDHMVHGPTPTDVLSAFSTKTVDGVVPEGARDGTYLPCISIGGVIFRVGDEISFPTDDHGHKEPLVASARVTLDSVGRDVVGLQVDPLSGNLPSFKVPVPISVLQP